LKINGNNNTQFDGNNNIVGNGNTVNNNHFYNGSEDKEPPKEEKVLPFTLKVYRRKMYFIDIFFIGLCFLGLIGSVKYQLELEYLISYIILVFLGWYTLPMKFSSLLVSVYSDRFSIGVEDNIVFFKDIRWYRWNKDTFSYKFHDDDVEHNIQFYKYSSAEYLFYRMEEFTMFHGIKIPRY
jgi:hypothetical protein